VKLIVARRINALFAGRVGLSVVLLVTWLMSSFTSVVEKLVDHNFPQASHILSTSHCALIGFTF